MQTIFQPGAATSSEGAPQKQGGTWPAGFRRSEPTVFTANMWWFGVGEDHGLWEAEKGVCWTPPALVEAPRGCRGPKDLIHRARGSWACPAPGLGAHQVLGPSWVILTTASLGGAPFAPSLPWAPSECVRVVGGHLCPTLGSRTWLCFQRDPFG